jgi:hypothetical protein
MAITFSRSMRSLKADGFRALLVWLLLAMALVIAWGGWFFLARVTLYETGQAASVVRGGTIVIDFPAKTAERIQPGQTASFHPAGTTDGQPIAVSAMVMKVTRLPRQDVVRVELLPQGDDIPPQVGTTGQVEIEVEYISPAALAVRAAQQFLGASQVPGNLQDNAR